MFFSLIFPIVMVASLGNILANLDNPDSSIGEIKIGYYAQAGAEAASSAEIFVSALGQADGIVFTEEKSEGAAKQSVADKGADAAMVFTGGDGVKVYEGGDDVKNRTVSMIAKGFARESAAYATAYGTVAAENPQNIPGLTDRLNARAADGETLTADRKFDGRTQSMMDFYAVTMIIMICFMGGGIGGASTMYLTKREGLLRRLAASPTRGGAIFIANIFVYIPVSIAQSLVIMLLSTLLFGAHYAATFAGNLLFFAFSVLLGMTVAAVCMLIGMFVKANPYMPFMAVLWTLLFISGSFNREIFIPGFSEYLPMNIMNRAAFELTLFGQSGLMLTAMAALAAILAATCVAGSLVLRRKERAL
jgi:ABC-2 type transport system permease protein